MTRKRMPGPRGRNRVATPTDLVGLGLIGFATNCLMVVFNTSGIEKKDTDKLGGGWGLAHLSLGSMMVILGVSDYLTGPLGALSGYPRIHGVLGGGRLPSQPGTQKGPAQLGVQAEVRLGRSGQGQHRGQLFLSRACPVEVPDHQGAVRRPIEAVQKTQITSHALHIGWVRNPMRRAS